MPTPAELDGRAYINFVKDALDYFVKQDVPTHPRILQRYILELEGTWANMNQDQKQYYVNIAIQQVNRLHRRNRQFQRIVDRMLDDMERQNQAQH